MPIRFSKWGLFVCSAYISFVVALLLYTSNCQGIFCQAGIVVAMLPWPIFFENGLQVGGLALTGMPWFWSAVILNTLILYFLFAALERWVKKSK